MEIRKDKRIQGLAFASALMLLIGLVMPVAMPGPFGGGIKFIFPTFMVFQFPGVPVIYKIMVFMPLISAILIFVARSLDDNNVRGALYLVAGFAPLIIQVLAQLEAIIDVGAMGRGGMFGMLGLSTLMGIMLGLGMILIVSAAIAGRVDLRNPIPGFAAAVGGAFLLIPMFLPIPGPGGSSTILMIFPFQAFGFDFFTGLMLLILLGLLVTCAVSGIIWGVQAQKGYNSSQSILILLMIFLVFVGIFFAITLMRDMRGGGAILTLITFMAYGLATSGGSFLAKCLGVIEFIAYRPKTGSLSAAGAPGGTGGDTTTKL